VRAEGPSKELDKLKIDKSGDTLRIGRVNSSGFNWGKSGGEDVRIIVTMPRIAEVGIAGSGNMDIDRIQGDSFKGETAGSGNLNVAALDVQTAEFSIAGSGDMKLSGTARELKIGNASGVKAQGADVSVAGSGDVRANVTGNAKVSVMGSGDVDLGPGAKCDTSKMGSGDVRCGG
jgi:hypothetical protein